MLENQKLTPETRVELSPFLKTMYNFEVGDLPCIAEGLCGFAVHNNGPEDPLITTDRSGG